MYQLRDYQDRVIREIFDWFRAGNQGHPIVSACVGAGKSVIIAEFCKRVIQAWPNQRIIMTVASRELVGQNYEKLLSIWPDAPAGLYSASFRKKEWDKQIVFASIGSIYNKTLQTGIFNLCLIDECHNVSRSESGMYREMIAGYTKNNPNFRVIGFTGTPFRGNGVWLWEGKEALFSGICSEVGIAELIDKGYLAPLKPAPVATQTDITGVGIRNGDFILAELARAVDKAPITSGAVSEILEYGKDRRSWLVFCTDLKHTEHVRDEIRSRGISCEMVSGETPTAERDRILNDFKAYRIRCVVNCQVLTTGFDHPGIDLIALLRNTRSPNLYVQIAGRGLRCIGGDIEASKRNGKSDCLWLDFTDTTETLGPVDKIKGRPEKPPKEKKSPPIKQCPKCQTINSAGSRYCVNCDYEFPVGEIDLRDTASRAAILSTNDPVIGKYPVDDVIYTIHEKPGSPSSLRVMYISGMMSFSEWICLEHDGWAKRKAASWWLERSGADFRVPATVSEAKERAGNLQIPAYIRVNESKKYPEVVGYEWSNWSNHENPEPDTETANLERAHGGRGAIAPNTGL